MLPCHQLQRSLIGKAVLNVGNCHRAHAVSRTFSVSARARQFIPDASETLLKTYIADPKNADKLILVDFYEDWCPPCKALSPLLHEIEGDPTLIGAPVDSLDLITVKGETAPSLAQEYEIRAVPTVVAFKKGAMVGQFVGALPLPKIRSWYLSLDK